MHDYYDWQDDYYDSGTVCVGMYTHEGAKYETVN